MVQLGKDESVDRAGLEKRIGKREEGTLFEKQEATSQGSSFTVLYSLVELMTTL